MRSLHGSLRARARSGVARTPGAGSRRRYGLLLRLVIVIVLVMPSAVQAASEPTGTLAAWLPPASTFGPEWVGSGAQNPAVTGSHGFVDGAAEMYLGPAGGRARIFILRHLTDRAAMNDAWSVLTQWFTADSQSKAYGSDPQRERSLQSAALPDGIVDARRFVGLHRYYPLEVCTGIYAKDPDIMMYIVVEGASALTDSDVSACDVIAAQVAARG